ncbi:ComF family protein [Aquibacillus kalidii]|uniref:ComF family protein n=1 Tax=Aquibacillus kalidii TaxID=2762597 RepID=UPI0016495ABF|nr:ComF family protein [Aquibacillus kalidii]
MYCLWCDEEILVEVNWTNFLLPDRPKQLCEACEKSLQRIEGAICKLCGRPSDVEVCMDCERWENDAGWKGVLTFNRSVFQYNSRMKEMIARWKYRGDYALLEAFRETIIKTFNQTFVQVRKDTILVPIPLSEERLFERGFNQAEALANLTGLPCENRLSRIHTEKQSKKTRSDRLATTNPFKIETKIDRPVILIDDIYTTGITLRHAASLLKKHGCPKVYSFTLVR